jgi:hypothetical protein
LITTKETYLLSPLSLADAVRVGGQGRPQIIDQLVEIGYALKDPEVLARDPATIGVCTLGAIYVGLTGNLPQGNGVESYRALYQVVEEYCGFRIDRVIVKNPDLTKRIPARVKLEDAIGELNDDGWTFEEIAQWLDTTPWVNDSTGEPL